MISQTKPGKQIPDQSLIRKHSRKSRTLWVWWSSKALDRGTKFQAGDSGYGTGVSSLPM